MLVCQPFIARRSLDTGLLVWAFYRAFQVVTSTCPKHTFEVYYISEESSNHYVYAYIGKPKNKFQLYEESWSH